MDDGLDPAGVAVFVAVICGITAIACGRPEQWGIRRLSLGMCAVSAAAAALLLAPSALWWGGVLWGIHQTYLGWSYISRRRRTSHERIEYLESSAAVLAYVALADGAIDPGEVAIIRDTYARAGFSPQDLREVDRIIQECRHRFLAAGSDPERLFIFLHDACGVVLRHSNEHTRLTFLRTAMIIAASDGFVSSGEERALRASANWLGISKADYDRLWRSVVAPEPEERQTGEAEPEPGRTDSAGAADEEPAIPPDLATYYASVLGVPLTVSPQELKRAYREKAKQYHPDVVAHRGPSFAREAEEKFKELSKAYEFFRGSAVAT